MTNILPVVSTATRFNIALEWLDSNAPFVVQTFWNFVKRSSRLDTALLNATHDETSADWKVLQEALLAVADECLSDKAMANMEDEVQHVILSMEVSQASMLEPHEEAAVWAYWERIDQQAAEQERYDMYMNEY